MIAGMIVVGRREGLMIPIVLDPHVLAHPLGRSKRNTKVTKAVGRRIDHNPKTPPLPMKNAVERKVLQRKPGLEVSKRSLLLNDLGQTRVLQNLLQEGTLN